MSYGVHHRVGLWHWCICGGAIRYTVVDHSGASRGRQWRWIWRRHRRRNRWRDRGRYGQQRIWRHRYGAWWFKLGHGKR